MVDYLLCADWAKERTGRALFMANVQTREVSCVRENCLSFDAALAHARRLANKGKVLLSFDLPLGLPNSFFSALRNVSGWQGVSSFIAFLPIAARIPTFFVSGTQASRWSLQQPFFAVPSGIGARAAFDEAAARIGVQLRRRIDVLTGGNPMFVTSGIPGSVGSGAINVWIELSHLVPHTRDFRVWPFEGDFPELFASAPIVIAENYPRAVYAAALSDIGPDCRARLRLSKTHEATRREVINCLASKSWVRSNGVKLNDTNAALTNENQFDALMTAAGLLRLVLEGEPLSCRALKDPVAEGGILGTGTINFNLPEADFAAARGARQGRPSPTDDDHLARKQTGCAAPASVYLCPIPGCPKVFIGSRGGWDGHVGAFRMHPNWQPHLTDHRDRLEAFRAEYPRFFE